MNQDILEKLADEPAPPPPVDLDRTVHRRVNESLVGLHAAEFVFKAAPFAVAHMLDALTGLVGFSLSGRWPKDKSDRR